MSFSYSRRMSLIWNRHGEEAFGVQLRFGIHMDEKIGIFAVKEPELLFENFKIPVRENEPGVSQSAASSPKCANSRSTTSAFAQ